MVGRWCPAAQTSCRNQCSEDSVFGLQIPSAVLRWLTGRMGRAAALPYQFVVGRRCRAAGFTNAFRMAIQFANAEGIEETAPVCPTNAELRSHMKKYLPCIAGVLLGLCFLAASIPVLLNLITIPKMPEGTPAASFMAAFVPTGYVKFVKMFELIGGIVVMIPRLRNIGLLLLGPVIVNIIAFHVLIDDPQHLLNPMLDIIIVCALYLLWDARKKFSGLLN
jgi:hypothetical protein